MVNCLYPPKWFLLFSRVVPHYLFILDSYFSIVFSFYNMPVLFLISSIDGAQAECLCAYIVFLLDSAFGFAFVSNVLRWMLVVYYIVLVNRKAIQTHTRQRFSSSFTLSGYTPHLHAHIHQSGSVHVNVGYVTVFDALFHMQHSEIWSVAYRL